MHLEPAFAVIVLEGLRRPRGGLRVHGGNGAVLGQDVAEAAEPFGKCGHGIGGVREGAVAEPFAELEAKFLQELGQGSLGHEVEEGGVGHQRKAGNASQEEVPAPHGRHRDRALAVAFVEEGLEHEQGLDLAAPDDKAALPGEPHHELEVENLGKRAEALEGGREIVENVHGLI